MTDTSGGEDTKIIFKDSVTGEIVSQEYAEKHPRRTYALEVPEGAPEDDVVNVFPVEEDTGEHDTLGED